MTPITLVSYNIHKGMSPLNRWVYLEQMAHALSCIAPDVLCLQEVQGQNLKRALAYNEYPDQSQHEWCGEYLALKGHYGKNAEYAHGHHGNAVLSRHPLDPKHNVNITVNRLEKRGVLHCEIMPKDWQKPLTVLCAHLNLLHHDRLKQYRAIVDYVSGAVDLSAPLVLAGDFNDWRKQSGKWLSELGMVEVFEATHGVLPKTFPARLPVLSLDRVYVRNLRIDHATVHTGAPWTHLSDHLPISVKIVPAES